MIEKILAHLELDSQPPPRGRGREAALHDVTAAKCKHLRPPQDRHRQSPGPSQKIDPEGSRKYYAPRPLRYYR
jgi:hypothetical protein